MKILVCGGSGCGKSTYAEKLAMSLDAECRYYIATMRPYDEECLKKIERHRQARSKGDFITLEKDVDINTLTLSENGCALLECVCNLCANEMFDANGRINADAAFKTAADILALADKCRHFIAVTNDVGSDIPLGYERSTLDYIDALGKINAELAAKFDAVYELVCGIPIPLKGELLL